MAPAPSAHYKLTSEFGPTIQMHPQAFIPQIAVDTPTYPQLHMVKAPVQVQAAPKPATSVLDNLSKADLIKLLLNQLAKEDADARV